MTLVTRFTAVAVAAVALAAAVAARAHRHHARRADPARPAQAAREEHRVRDLDIAFFEARAARDPYGAADAARLSALLLARGRATGSPADLSRAEAVARRSLDLRGARNDAARLVLVNALMGRHAFLEARREAERLVAQDPAELGRRALLGEILLELGDHDAAGAEFRRTLGVRGNPTVAARVSRWYDVTGRTALAHHWMLRARDAALALHAVPVEQVAWFHWRVADLALRHGHLGEAADALAAGLAVAPDDHRLHAALARLHLARGRAREAAAEGERALATALDPATLAIVSDAYALQGNAAEAARYAAALEAMAFADSLPPHRAWSLFLLDHGRRVPEVLARARADLRQRHDVHAWDVYAWALFRAGRAAEADAAMAKALAAGTEDAQLAYHAGVIAEAVGDTERASAWLLHALEWNDRWDPFQPADARARLGRIGRARQAGDA
ncbi:MAG: hypothetical protein NW201_02325 [Gemmatimonadales bacterium]|nr:hypothetical protein [Gemmatimonadales bacterium]